MFLFKKKENTPAVPEFSMGNFLFQNAKEIKAEAILLNNSPQLEKLNNWFGSHPKAMKYLYFYHVDNIDGIQNFDEIRKNSIKSQISKSLELIQQLENSTQNKHTQKFSCPQHPNIQIQKVHKVKNNYKKVCINTYIIDQITEKIDDVVDHKKKMLKSITVSLISLLSSNAIPHQYIPIIRLDDLSVSRSYISSNDSLCCWYQELITRFQQQNGDLLGEIAMVSGTFLDDGIESNIEAFKAVLSSYNSFFNSENGYIQNLNLLNGFTDFIYSNSVVIPLLESLKENKCYESFLEDMINLFRLQNEEIELFVSLCSYFIAPIFCPDIGPPSSSLDKEQQIDLEIAFIYFVENDPIMILKNLQKDKNTIQNIANALAQYTKDWKEIFKFVLDFTIDKFLKPELKIVRDNINEFIQSLG